MSNARPNPITGGGYVNPSAVRAAGSGGGGGRGGGGGGGDALDDWASNRRSQVSSSSMYEALQQPGVGPPPGMDGVGVRGRSRSNLAVMQSGGAAAPTASAVPMVAAGKPRQAEPYDAFRGGRRGRNEYAERSTSGVLGNVADAGILPTGGPLSPTGGAGGRGGGIHGALQGGGRGGAGIERAPSIKTSPFTYEDALDHNQGGIAGVERSRRDGQIGFEGTYSKSRGGRSFKSSASVDHVKFGEGGVCADEDEDEDNDLMFGAEGNGAEAGASPDSPAHGRRAKRQSNSGMRMVDNPPAMVDHFSNAAAGLAAATEVEKPSRSHPPYRPSSLVQGDKGLTHSSDAREPGYPRPRISANGGVHQASSLGSNMIQGGQAQQKQPAHAGRTAASALGNSEAGMVIRPGVGAPAPNPKNYAYAGKSSASHFQGPEGLGQRGDDKPRRQPASGGEWATTHDSSYR